MIFPPCRCWNTGPTIGSESFTFIRNRICIAAIRRGDRGEARRIINHVLVHIYSAGEGRSDLLKGLLLELVVMISRAAVEAGAVQSELLGMSFRLLTELADIDDDELLVAWLRKDARESHERYRTTGGFHPAAADQKSARFYEG